MNSIGGIKNKNILFLQGPMGPFFKKMDTLFKQEGATTYKVGFNAGDCLFSNFYNYTSYRGTREEWPEFIENFLYSKKIDKIFLFGDCRYYQSMAIKEAMKIGVDVYVFEEGYVRPNYITMEKYGVNNYSRISRDPNFYKSLKLKTLPKPKDAKQSKFKLIMSSAIYYLASNLLYFRYPNYQHHRDFSAIKEFFYGIRGVWRKYAYKLSEAGYLEKIEAELSKKYYFVPLQTYNDFQILEHSSYKSVEKFIIEVLESFASFAPKDKLLIFKHHPVDRGRKNYKKFIMEQAELFGVESRIEVVHDVYLPSCLQHAIGTVTINSTVGMSSLLHDTPTITLGNAIYDIEGLTCKGMRLDEFWHKQVVPDEELYKKYRNYLVQTTQLNGSFYGEMPKFDFSEKE
jgi:capsular polysaccharide export protein